MRLLIFKLCALSFLVQNAPVFACVGEPLVQTRAGKVQGTKQIGSEGDEFCAFKGIPYAKPPVGELRFQDPEPAEPWTGVLEATAYGNICAQFDWFANKIYGVEDCLTLNVYTKSVKPNMKRPVMLWIHGGGFTAGNGMDEFYGPDYLMRKDIVLITINYRLGVFGFLNLDHELAAGNQGMKDMVLALQWVRENIENFGGDPDNVTIFGESAGGAAVHYLTLSPLAKGLFHKAISQSGSILNPWAFFTSVKGHAIELCKILGHTDQSTESVIQFLRKADAQKILKAKKNLLTKEEKAQGVLTFGPTIDSKSKNPFLPVHPRVAAAAGVQVPLMIGHNTREGIITFRTFIGVLDRFNNEFAELLHPDSASIIKEYGMSTEDLKKMYFKNEPINKNNVDALVDLYGDLYFVEGVHTVLRIQAEKSSSPTYFNKFTYDNDSIFKVILRANFSGSSHADDIFYYFRAKFLEGRRKFPEKGSEKYTLMEQMVEMWVNFATTGTPTPNITELLPVKWEPITNGTVFPYMNIDKTLHMESMKRSEMMFIMQ